MKSLQLLFLLISALAFSQNDMKAKIEYEDAETTFASGDYEKTVDHLAEAEKLLGKWTPKVGYLMILSLDKTVDYENTEELKPLQEQIKKYMQFAAKTKDLDKDKFREINKIEKYVTSASNKFEDSDVQLANEYFKKKEYEPFFNYSKKSADRGNLYAMTFIGWAYDNGNGIAQNTVEAEKWYKIPAERKIKTAMNNLGAIYFNVKNYQEAKKWFEKSAAKGDNNSRCSLGIMYYSGLGVNKDYDKALDWYDKALDKDFIPDAYNMQVAGHLYYTKKEYEKAVKWFKASYENGNSEEKNIAKGYIARMYEEGWGVEKNKKTAREWRKK